MAVSYTHLDVYKRQIVGKTGFCNATPGSNFAGKDIGRWVPFCLALCFTFAKLSDFRRSSIQPLQASQQLGHVGG